MPYNGLNKSAANLVTASFQIATSIPLVSDQQDLTILKKEYAEDDTIYQQKIRVRCTRPCDVPLVFLLLNANFLAGQ